MRYEGNAKITLKGDKKKASQLISQARTWLGKKFGFVPKGKSFRYSQKQLHGIVFSCYVNGHDVIIEIFVPVSKQNIYFIFDPHSFQQPYGQGWGEPFFSSAGQEINYPYGSDLNTLESNGLSFKQALVYGNKFVHQFGVVPPAMPGNCLWLSSSSGISVSWWGNTNGCWSYGKQPGGFGPPAFFRPNEMFVARTSASPQRQYYLTLTYAKEPLPAGSSVSQIYQDFLDDNAWGFKHSFGGNSTIWVDGKPENVTVAQSGEGTIIAGACIIGNWLIYMCGALDGTYGVSEEYIYKHNLSTGESFLLNHDHYDMPNDVQGNNVSWVSNTSNASVSADGRTWCYTRINFLDEEFPSAPNYEQHYYKLLFSLDDSGDIKLVKSHEKSNPTETKYLAFGEYDGEIYYLKPEVNNSDTYETYMFWMDIRWNCAVGIQSSWGASPEYLFVKVHGKIFKYKFGPNKNNLDFNSPEEVEGEYAPDSLGPLSGPGYDYNRVNGTFLAFDGGVIFSISGAHFNPALYDVINSSNDYSQYNQRGYCVLIKADGTAVNLHSELLDDEFDLRNGRFSTIMLSTGEIEG